MVSRQCGWTVSGICVYITLERAHDSYLSPIRQRPFVLTIPMSVLPLAESEPDHARYISGGQWKLAAGDDTEVLPAWVKYWAGGFADKFRELHGDDFLILSRNAWAGTWSSGAALWSGDVGSSFGELETAVAAGQGAAMSGVALWTTDTGGCKWRK
jgi:alpha-glucosidase (family GH31 glycosyl hydrolase)